MSCQTQLMEVSQLRQRLEETLRQRERELTALKGALKEEVANHDKEIENLREQYGKDMEKLRSSMEQVSQVCVRTTLSEFAGCHCIEGQVCQIWLDLSFLNGYGVNPLQGNH